MKTSISFLVLSLITNITLYAQNDLYGDPHKSSNIGILKSNPAKDSVVTTNENASEHILRYDSLNNFYFGEVIKQIQGVAQHELYQRAKIWTLKNLKSSDNQILYDDVDKKSIIGTGNIRLKEYRSYWVELLEPYFDFKISIQLKDGKYKCRIDNITFYARKHVQSAGKTLTSEEFTCNIAEFKLTNLKKENEKIKKDIHSQINEKLAYLIKSLESSLQNNTEDSDW